MCHLGAKWPVQGERILWRVAEGLANSRSGHPYELPSSSWCLGIQLESWGIWHAGSQSVSSLASGLLDLSFSVTQQWGPLVHKGLATLCWWSFPYCGTLASNGPFPNLLINCYSQMKHLLKAPLGRWLAEEANSAFFPFPSNLVSQAPHCQGMSSAPFWFHIIDFMSFYEGC